MASNFYGIASYQQTTTFQKTFKQDKSSPIDSVVDKASTAKTNQTATKAEVNKVETTPWKPIDTSSSLVPTNTDDYGMAIGNVKLSDAAKDYYKELKGKFANSNFILVSNDMKSQVQQNASAYGNANGMVILIDEEKLERMATDESYRKKYEGIIKMSETLMQQAKNSLSSTGASVKNFGMSVDSNGNTSFFATLEKASDNQTKLMEKKAKAKKEAKLKEKKATEKREKEERLEKAKEKSKAQKEEMTDRLNSDEEDIPVNDDKEYVDINASSIDDLLSKVSDYAISSSLDNVMTASEKAVGQHFDFKG
ncbi:MAG: hypothetical protein II699_00240 [Lachnospiraceae bacterium]|jgi:hypothetical protein|nr:hypothetical protein [Lachnospiraceae bacterium]